MVSGELKDTSKALRLTQLSSSIINNLLQGCEDERETEKPSDTSDSGIINFVINKN